MWAMNIHACELAMDLPPVFGQSSAAVQPCKGPLDNPSARDDFELFGGVGYLDDLDCPLTRIAQGIA